MGLLGGFLDVLLWVSITFLRRSYMIFWVIRKVYIKYGTMVNIAKTHLKVIRKVCIKYGTMVNIAKTHLSRHKIIYVLRSFVDPISVDVSDNSEIGPQILLLM